GERGAVGVAALLERGIDDGGGLRERDDGHGGSIDAVMMVSSPLAGATTVRGLIHWLTAWRGLPNRPTRPILPPRPRPRVWSLRSRRASFPRAAARPRGACPRPAWYAGP